MRPIQFYTIKSSGGLKAEISNLGAKITKLLVSNRKGEVKDVVLGFKTAEEWRTQETYFNAICGRVANRIGGGVFSLQPSAVSSQPIEYHLPINNGPNSLHGGLEGFNAKIWDVTAQSAYEITLHYRSKDGEEGYPGNLDVWVTYTATKDNVLRIHYEAKTDAPTIAAFTNHAYFNLAGEAGGRVDDHVLQVFAEQYTPFDEFACPTGEIKPVEGCPMDFRQPVRIGDRIHDAFFAPGRGIDNNWCLCEADAPKALRHAATLQADGRTMECWTTMKGLQVYTGNYIEQHIGKSGTMYDEQHAVCLEAQNWPDGVHHDDFPNIVLQPNEKLDEITEYRFL
ncbi:MAG: galactose mutarotase [Paludibacteraceae bacterium]|nr:galactose mutarotase [Paludibacteraceae bacterium]MBQ2520869.1 galactose mutarotase [Paludibacteraceae bacterium]MBQ4017820.1 galactose mutarotase [Paludibacteraceae bacterium]